MTSSFVWWSLGWPCGSHVSCGTACLLSSCGSSTLRKSLRSWTQTALWSWDRRCHRRVSVTAWLRSRLVLLGPLLEVFLFPALLPEDAPKSNFYHQNKSYSRQQKYSYSSIYSNCSNIILNQVQQNVTFGGKIKNYSKQQKCSYSNICSKCTNIILNQVVQDVTLLVVVCL